MILDFKYQIRPFGRFPYGKTIDSKQVSLPKTSELARLYI